MDNLTVSATGFEWRSGHEVLRAEAWGNGVRVRAGLGRILDDVPHALLDDVPKASAPAVVAADDSVTLRVADLSVVLSADGRLSFSRIGAAAPTPAEPFLAEQPAHFWWPGPRLFAATANGYHRIEQRFRAWEGERFYGLGQHTHGLFDQKGAVIDLLHRNGEVSIPFVISSRGYGFLWNSPALGRVELASNGTRWVADSARQIDYWVTAGEPATVLEHYTEVTGRPPVFPSWASGFWQSKLRYQTQEQLLGVAREHHRRGLPMSVIVIDFFHGTHVGDYRFDPAEWPDPRGMVDELAGMGVEVMVSVWPTVTAVSRNFPVMAEKGLFVRNERGAPVHVDAGDKGVVEGRTFMAYYDSTNPAAREFIWEQVQRGYHDHGISIWWLDAGEPEIRPLAVDNLLFHAGPGLEVANLYPRENARTFWEGMRAAGETEILTLNRSAWAGSQRYGAAVWSGDIKADFESLAQQIRAGLNMALSGFSWWTTDIGGFHGGDPEDPEFRELMIRWFQFGVFCPITRLHGDREPRQRPGPLTNSGPNEVWSFGDEVYEELRRQLFLRERLRGYIHDQMAVASERGLPPMRPLLVDHPHDPEVWTVDDQYTFGSDLIVAPVLEYGARSRQVYLPAGERWRHVWTGTTYEGGRRYDVEAPLSSIPVFARDGAETGWAVP
ncbi:glycoside hydrolase family 31 protein [Jiangella aurantiaca]|uniref:Glycoside hydrolase family 31 protein n=1 Tax=Jiangella aurantiaca TaxID=2530373 RepID=A0A4R5AHD2_9ACTN|nr:TIM-barrel domain-containing protein [Jiangella aurantiaca]TDD71871.1 glycoside hydrolase family 31 protein [Jiangella aurantiaca]